MLESILNSISECQPLEPIIAGGVLGGAAVMIGSYLAYDTIRGMYKELAEELRGKDKSGNWIMKVYESGRLEQTCYK